VISGARQYVNLSGNPAVTLQRVRVRLSRDIDAAGITHLQQIELIKKMILASGWPIALSGSKRSRPRISFGPAISVGYLSEAEYFDVELASRLDLAKAPTSLAPHLPPGYQLIQLKSIPRFFPSLDQSLNMARYKISSKVLEGSRGHWENFWKKENFFVTKKKEDRDVVIDARPCVKSWDLVNGDLDLFLRFGPGRTLKPEKIIQAVCGLTDEQTRPGINEGELRVLRLQLFFEKDTGVLNEP